MMKIIGQKILVGQHKARSGCEIWNYGTAADTKIRIPIPEFGQFLINCKMVTPFRRTEYCAISCTLFYSSICSQNQQSCAILKGTVTEILCCKCLYRAGTFNQFVIQKSNPFSNILSRTTPYAPPNTTLPSSLSPLASS